MKILACVLLFIFLALLIPVAVYVNSEPETVVVAKYLWFRIKILPKKLKRAGDEKPEKIKKPKKPREKQLISGSWDETLDLARRLLGRVSPIVRRMLRRTTVAKLNLHIIVAKGDAARTAIKFGQVNAQVFSALAFAGEIVKLKADRIEITPGFGVSEGKTSYSGELRLVPLALLTATVQVAFWGLVSAWPLLFKQNKNSASKKSAGSIAGERKEDRNGEATSVERGA